MSRKDLKLQKNKHNYVIMRHCFCISIQIIDALTLEKAVAFDPTKDDLFNSDEKSVGHYITVMSIYKNQ